MMDVTHVNDLNIALLNVSGIDTSLDLVVQYLETNNIYIILLTETFLTKGNLYSQWSQHHNYATIPGTARKGFGGLSFLIRPNFPYHVHALPSSSSYRLSIVIGSSLTLHGFYLHLLLCPFQFTNSC
jgi:exonuclease III